MMFSDILEAADDLVTLHEPEEFWAVGSFFSEFSQVSDAEVMALLQGRHSSTQP